ncbi:MAG: class B sortase [Ruminococcus sp.]|nr:class B sortase [Ruminococcus sp.]
MDRDKRSKIIVISIILVLLIIIGILGYYLFNLFTRGTDVSEYRVKDNGTASSVSDTASGSADKADNPINFKKLQQLNPEIFGWLYIPDTNIDYPLLQSNERDDFYLHSDIYRNYKYAGSLYTEYCNSTDLDDRVTVIYGHNMIDGSMFANLHKFRDTAFFNKHKEFYIYTPSRKLTYQVVSAYEFDDRHIMNTYNFAQNEVFESYLDYIQNPHSVSSNVNQKLDHKLTVKDKIVTLSTCLDSGDGRYLLQGVLVKDEPTG